MERDIDEINVVPLVDVMLVLLVIVLTTATFIVRGEIPVDLAQAGAAARQSHEPLLFTLVSDGQVYFQDRPVTSEDLPRLLARYDHGTPIVIRADRAVALERFVSLTDAIRKLGFGEVNLEVERR